jgi:hypothetical protein
MVSRLAYHKASFLRLVPADTAMSAALALHDVSVGRTGTYVTDGVDDDVQINAAISAVAGAGGGIVRLLPGNFYGSNRIDIPSNVIVEGSGPGITTLWMGVQFPTVDNYFIGATGAETTGVPILLTSDAAFGSQALTVPPSAETAALSRNEHLFLRAATRTEALVDSPRYIGEFVKVLGVSGDKVRIFNTLRDGYTTAAGAQAYRVSFVENFGLRHLTIRQQAAPNTRGGNVALVGFIKTKRGILENVVLRDNDGPGLIVQQSMSIRVSDNTIRDLMNNPAEDRYGYGVIVGGASEGILISSNDFENMRHAVDAGPQGWQTPASNAYGVARGVSVVGNVARRIVSACYSTHSDAEAWSFTGNVASNCLNYGFFMRGRGMSIHANTVEHCAAGIGIGDTTFNNSGGSAAGSSVVGNKIRHIKRLTDTDMYADAGLAFTTGSGDGIVLGLTDSVVVQDNIIEYCDRSGIVLRRSCCRSIIRKNAIINTNCLDAPEFAQGSGAIEIDVNYRGTSASIAHASGKTTLSGVVTTALAIQGRKVTIEGAASAGNNGTFVILATDILTNSFTYMNPSGVDADANNGDITYWIEGSTNNLVEGNIAINTPSIYETNATGHIQHIVRDAAVTGSVPANDSRQGNIDNVFKDNIGIGLGSTHLWIANQNHVGEGEPVKVVNGVPTDAHFLETPPVGTLAYNSATGTLYARSTTAWNAIESGAGSDATDSTNGILRLAGDLAGDGGTAAAPRVSAMSGDTTGFAFLTAPNGLKDLGNPNAPADTFKINAITPTTSPTVLLSIPTTAGRTYSIRGLIRVQNAPASAYGEWDIRAFYRNNVGVLSTPNPVTVIENANSSGFALTFAEVGANLVLTATDPVGGRRWTGGVYVEESVL